MIRKLLFSFLILFSHQLIGQTTIIDPSSNGGFESGATFATNGWTVTNGGANQNQWVCSTGATVGFSGNRAAYVSQTRNGTPPHTYINSVTRVSHFYRNVIIPAGEDQISLNFDWICDGESIFDWMRVWLVPTSFNPNYGTQITAAGIAPTGRIQLGGDFSEQYTWTNTSLTIPASYAGNSFRLVFEWRNDGSLGGNPPAAVDNISLISSAPTPCPGITTTFYDSGGAAGNYSNNEDLTWTFYPDGGPVTATFTAFDLEANWDYLYVYDGPNDTYPQIGGGYTGTGIPGPFTSTDPSGALTFVFDSDGSTTEPGWEATICGTATPPACTAPTTPSNIAFGTVTDVVINGSFTGSGADNYLVLMNSTGTPPTAPTDGVNYTIGDTSLGATVIDNDGDTSFTATGLTGNTTYYFYIYAFNGTGCSGGPLYSPTSLTGNTTTDPPTYCTPSSTSSSYYIDDFITTGGTTNINHTGTGFSPGGYGDFTGLSVEQIVGSDVDFTINYVGGTFASKIWVDWNNDLDFDDTGELVFQAGYADPTIGNFTIPNVAGASYRMRVRADWSNTDVDSCGDDDRSETHDYTLIVTPLNCTDDPINITANSTTPTSATISWTHSTPQPSNGYEYIISTDNTTTTPAGDITGTTAGNSINLTGLTAGTTYYVFIRGDCGGGDLGIWITTVFTTGCTNTVATRTVCPIIVDEATNNPFIADPFVADPTAQLDCDNGDITLAAHANLRETTSYIVEKIAYPSPAPNYDFPLPSGSLLTIGDDDEWANMTTTMPFDFSFFNQCYNEFLIGANGMITFDLVNNTPGSYCGWQFSDNLPSTNNSLFEQTIYGVYHDIDPRGLTGNPIKTRVYGTAPCRQVQISWVDIPMFGDATRLYTGMIVLHETTNIIEVFIEEKVIENGNVSPWNGGNAIVGIQGDITPLAPNNEYTVAPCRNGLDTNWETFNEAWRFVPNGAVINPNTVTWYEGSIAPGNILTANVDDTVTVNSANTYIAVTDYTICGNSITLTDDILVTDSRKVWNGSVDTDWYTAANWTPLGIPTNLDCIVVPDVTTTFNRSPIVIGGPPTPPLPGEGRSLRVESNGYVELEQYANLIITDAIYIENTIVPNGKIILRSGSNLVQITNTGITNTGNIQMQRSVSGLTPQDYVYWSSPVNGFDVNDVSPGSSLIYKWIPTIGGNGAGNYGNWQATGEPMQTGVGYIIQGVSGTSPETTAAANTVEFIGTPKNGAYSVPILRGSYNGVDYTGAGGTMATALDDNWNLIGNPYPSAIFADEFITQNADLDDTADPNTPAIFGTVYLWRHQTAPSTIADPFYGDFVYNYNPNDYIGYNSTGSNPAGFNGYIGSGQAFFVLMDHNATTPSNVVFNNDMRLDAGAPVDNNQFYRTHERNNRSNYEKHRIWLDLITPSNTANSILVGYIENATNQFDRLYDGFELSETTTRFYSIIDQADLAIQGRTLPFDETDLVPLGLEIPEAGNYTIAINTLDGLFENEEQNIYLEDTYNNFIHDLRLSPYSFNSDVGEFNDRFILRYTNNSLSVDEFESGSELSISAPGNNFIKVIASNSPIKSITIYDVLGRVLYTNNSVNKLEFRIDNIYQSDGVLFVKAELESGMQKIQKVILKH